MLRREHNERMSLAWHIARLNAYAPKKAREFIKLSELIQSETTPQRRQTGEAQLAIARSWMASRRAAKKG